jgi:hypothetical protein
LVANETVYKKFMHKLLATLGNYMIKIYFKIFRSTAYYTRIHYLSLCMKHHQNKFQFVSIMLLTLHHNYTDRKAAIKPTNLSREASDSISHIYTAHT